MRFHANYISTSVSGDYYQAMFEAEKDTDDPLSPYLLIQRQFEIPDEGMCYVETHDDKYIGHFLLQRVEFTTETCQSSSTIRASNLSVLPLALRSLTSKKRCGW
jgi:hypothetical protein